MNGVIPDSFGTADLIGRAGDIGVILDWKFGRGVAVSAENNSQGKYYALGVLNTPGVRELWDGITEVMIVIVQPAFGISKWTTTLDDLNNFKLQLIKADAAMRGDDPPFALGSHCKFCAAKPACPLMQGKADQAFEQGLTVPESFDNASLSGWLDDAKHLEDWIKSVREMAFNQLHEGQDVPGWKMVAKQGRKAWNDEAEVAGKMKNQRMTLDDCQPRKLLSPAQMAKILEAKGKVLDEGLYSIKSSGTTIAPESDKRPAIVVTEKALEELSNMLGAI